MTFPSKEEGKIGAHGSLTSSFGWDVHLGLMVVLVVIVMGDIVKYYDG